MKRKFLTLFLALTLVIAGCSNTPSGNSANSGTNNNDSTNNTGNNSDNSSINSVQMPDTSDLFTDRDYEVGYNENKSALIELNGSSASCTSNAVEISGSTITITDEGTYVLKGTLDDGMIIVNTDKEKKVQLYLDNVTIHSETSAPIYVLQSDKVFITLAPDSENTLSNSGSFVTIDDNNIDSVIFSKEDLTLNGSGSLTINSPAGHGIVSKDELTFTSGTYHISSASHGITGKDNLCIANAVFHIEAGKDGLRADHDEDTSLGFVYIQSGTFDITAEGDGMSASSTLQIDEGTFEIVSGGGSENGEKQTSDSWGGFPGNMGGGMRPGMGGGQRPGGRSVSSATTTSTTADDDSTSIKGLKSAGNMLIENGSFHVNSADDTIHSNASITISGGTFDLASGDDGIHADDTLEIKGGTISISESYEGLEGLHIYVYDGDINLKASDDGLNAAGGTDSSGYGGNRGNDRFGGGMGPGMGGSSNGSINILGGNLYANASGDGIDANGTISISGGYTVVCGPTQGDTATLDYDTSATITGGTFIGTGASGMAQTFSDSKQGVIAVSVGNQSAGTKITLEDTDGNVILTHEPELNFAVVILSSSDMAKGETYKIIVGEASGEFEAF